MIGVVNRSPAAVLDLDETAAFLQRRDGPDRAIRFLREAEATFARLATMPNLGATYQPDAPRHAGLRYASISQFKKHFVFYRPSTDGIEVLRVIHGSRDLEGLLTPDPEGEDEAPQAG